MTEANAFTLGKNAKLEKQASRSAYAQGAGEKFQPRAHPWINGLTRLRGASLLSLLIIFDLAFIAVHIWLRSRGLFDARFDVARDGSVPEWFNYAKWAASALACGYCFWRRREPLYLTWAMLFVYFLVDDATRIHESLGERLATAFDLSPALALRAVDFGELIAVAGAGIALFGAMAIAYRAADLEAKDFTHRQFPWLGLLIFFGIVIDMVHIQIQGLASPRLSFFAAMLEDGGEMIAASFLTAISVRQAALIGLGPLAAPEPAEIPIRH